MADSCRSCGAPIRFVTMTGSGKANPLDIEPAEKGNVLVGEDGKGSVPTKHKLPELRASGTPLHLSHFVTCPQRRQWRR